MSPFYASPPVSRAMFVLSAAAAALSLRLAWYEPVLGLVLLVMIFAAVGSRWWAQQRMRHTLRSGDLDSVVEGWRTAVNSIPHRETMEPLMVATALTAYGWVKRARSVLRTAARGPAWDAAVEHRLFLDTLLLTFEGNCDGALSKAESLQSLPMPVTSPQLIARVQTLRKAVGALVRAFAHHSREGDRTLLLEASDSTPLMHWAMRYGAAIIAVDAGELGQARALLKGAPNWPTESCFSSFHDEIAAEVERLRTAREHQVGQVQSSDESPQRSNSPGDAKLSEPEGVPSSVNEEQ